MNRDVAMRSLADPRLFRAGMLGGHFMKEHIPFLFISHPRDPSPNNILDFTLSGYRSLQHAEDVDLDRPFLSE